MPGVLIYSLSLTAAWWILSAGNVLASSSFFSWAGEHPALHRMLFTGGLTVIAGLIALLALALPVEARKILWFFRLWNALNKSHGTFASCMIAASAAGVVAGAAIARYDAFGAGFDLAVFDQALWNTLHGKFLWSSIKGHTCLLGDHMSPVLLLYLPGMALWQDPRMLLCLQAAVFGINILLVHALCRQRWDKSAWNWILPLAYALYLPARNAAQFDFHPEILADTFILLFFFCLFSGRRAGLVLSLIGLVLCKETFWALIFFLGIFLVFFGRRFWTGRPFAVRALGLAMVLLAPLAFWLEIHALIPWISGTPYPYTGNYVGGGWIALLEQGFSLPSLMYIVKIFAPLGFVSFACPPLLLPASFGLIQNLFSVNPATHSIYFHYTIGLTPFVFVAALRGAPSGDRWALAVLACSILLAGVPDMYRVQVYERERAARGPSAEAALQSLPAHAIIKTNEFFAAHLAHRPYLYVPDDGGFWPFERQAGADIPKFAVMGRGFGGGYNPENIKFLKEHGYTVLREEDGICVMQEIP